MLSADLFRKAEEKFFALKRDLVAGRIDLEDFHNALKDAKVSDHWGRTWTIGAKSGKWFYNDGQAWVQADPYLTLADEFAGTITLSKEPPPTPSQVAPGAEGTTPAAVPAEPETVATIPEVVSSPANPPITTTALAPSADDLIAVPAAIGPIPSIQVSPATGVGTRPRTQTWLFVILAFLGMCALLCFLAAFALVLASRIH